MQLLGVRQVFSMALHPQSQAICERSHREIKNALMLYLDSLARKTLRTWPRWLRVAEHRFRHHQLYKTGITPYALVHGFWGGSALDASFARIKEVLPGTAHDEWIRDLIVATNLLAEELHQVQTDLDERAAQDHADTNAQHPIDPGNLVFVERGTIDRLTGPTLARRSSGPYRVLEVDSHGAVLGDAITSWPTFRGSRIALKRLVPYYFPLSEDDAPRMSAELGA